MIMLPLLFTMYILPVLLIIIGTFIVIVVTIKRTVVNFHAQQSDNSRTTVVFIHRKTGNLLTTYPTKTLSINNLIWVYSSEYDYLGRL